MRLGRRSTIIETDSSPHLYWAIGFSVSALVEILLALVLPGWLHNSPDGGFTGFWLSCHNRFQCTVSYLVSDKEFRGKQVLLLTTASPHPGVKGVLDHYKFYDLCDRQLLRN